MVCIRQRPPSGRALQAPCRVPRAISEAKKGTSQAWDEAIEASRAKNASKAQRSRESYGDGVSTGVVEGDDEDELVEISDAATEKVVTEEVADAATEKVVGVAESFVTEKVVAEEVAKKNNGKGKANCTAMDVEEEEEEVAEMTSKLKRRQEEDPQKEEPVEPKKKPRKRRSSPANAAPYHSPLFEKLGSRELFEKAKDQRVISESKPRKEKGKEGRYISPREAYKVLGLTLTEDRTKSLVYGKVFFDPRVFEDTSATSPSSWHYKFLPYDAGLLGVEVGTRVWVDTTLGTVKSVKHNDVVIQVEGRPELAETVLFVLQYAVEGQRVTSLEKAQRKFILDLVQIIALTHIDATIFIENDGDRTHKDNMFHHFDKETVILEGKSKPDELESLRKYKDDVEKCNPMVWSVLSQIPADQALHQVPLQFSNSLTEFIGGSKSLMEMLGFQHLKENKVIGPEVPETGIFGKNRAIRPTGNAAGFVNALAKFFQEASMLGRFINFQSITAPLTQHELEFLLRNAKKGMQILQAEEDESSVYKWDDWENLPPTTKATEAILSLRSGFIPRIHLGAIRIFTREKGELAKGSVGGYFSHMQKVGPARQQSMDGDEKDEKFFKKVSHRFLSVSREIRSGVKRQIEQDKQGALKKKVESGATHADIAVTRRLMDEAVDTVWDGFLKGFVNMFKPAELELGKRLLKEHSQTELGTAKDESHICTKEVIEVAQRVMDEEGVTCDYASEVTKFMFFEDRLLSSPVRRINHSGMWARDTYLDPSGNKVKDFFRNKIKDEDGKDPMTIIHSKHEKIEDAHVLMVVFLRAVFKLCLPGEDELDNEIFPLDPWGHKFSEGNRGLFLKTAGMWFLGLHNFREHSLRNIHFTGLMDWCLEKKIVPSASPLVAQSLLDTHTTLNMADKHYYESRNFTSGNGISMYKFDPSILDSQEHKETRELKRMVENLSDLITKVRAIKYFRVVLVAQDLVELLKI